MSLNWRSPISWLGWCQDIRPDNWLTTRFISGKHCSNFAEKSWVLIWFLKWKAFHLGSIRKHQSYPFNSLLLFISFFLEHSEQWSNFYLNFRPYGQPIHRNLMVESWNYLKGWLYLWLADKENSSSVLCTMQKWGRMLTVFSSWAGMS